MKKVNIQLILLNSRVNIFKNYDRVAKSNPTLIDSPLIPFQIDKNNSN